MGMFLRTGEGLGEQETGLQKQKEVLEEPGRRTGLKRF